MRHLLITGVAFVLCIVPLLSLAQEDRLITADEFIKKLGGESAVEEIPVKTRGLRGTRNIVVRPKEVTVKIHFKFNSTEIADERSRLQLTEVGKALSADKLSDIKVEIAGHTDSKGSREYNQWLSKRRADAIKDALVRYYNISPDRLVSKGYGEDYPIASNYDEQGRAENRRVVIKRKE